MINKLLCYKKYGLCLLKYLILSYKHSKDLCINQNNLAKIRKDDILLFCTLRNEAIRIEFFLDYYRKIGVNHFIFVDNGSTDNFKEIIKNEKDVSSFYTEASYKESNFGMHWLNYLLRKYGNNHWCLTCDPDEFLVYPKNNEYDLYSLTKYFDSNHVSALFTIMIDMYSNQEVKEYISGDDPLKYASFFDRTGYFFTEDYNMNSLWVQGGVRLRKLFKKNPEISPAINKTPLIKWKWFYVYISSMHLALPRRLNGSYRSSYTGALLHFKYLSTFSEKVKEEIDRGQHYGDSQEYNKYLELLENNNYYIDGVSIKYKDVDTLLELNLVINNELE